VRLAYFDASAIVKLTATEPESLDLVDYLSADVQVSTSAIADVEVVRTLQRMQFGPSEQDNAMRGFHLIHFDADIRHTATRLTPAALRTLDAIHVATALAIGDSSLEFVTYDNRMADAARECGLRVVQPGR
jgi:predicted nucleic acid-binding protein